MRTAQQQISLVKAAAECYLRARARRAELWVAAQQAQATFKALGVVLHANGHHVTTALRPVREFEVSDAHVRSAWDALASQMEQAPMLMADVYRSVGIPDDLHGA